eukprot:3935771-Rhodomonas_salina.3
MRVSISGFGVWGLGFGVWGLGFGVWGAGFRILVLIFGFQVRVKGQGLRWQAVGVGVHKNGCAIPLKPEQNQSKAGNTNLENLILLILPLLAIDAAGRPKTISISVRKSHYKPFCNYAAKSKTSSHIPGSVCAEKMSDCV